MKLRIRVERKKIKGFYTGTQKAKIALKAVKGIKTINAIAQDNSLHLTQVSQWKRELMDNAGSLFDVKRGPKLINTQNDPDHLYAKIGQLNMGLDWLKKVWTQSIAERQSWIAKNKALALSLQCNLLKVNR